MTHVEESFELDPSAVRLGGQVFELEHQQSTGPRTLTDAHVEIARRDATIENLNIALVSSRQIGTAMGILMASLKITSDDAFQLLRIGSQKQNRKLREVAEDVVLTGSL